MGIFKLLKYEIAADRYQSAIEEEGCVSKLCFQVLQFVAV